MVRFVERGWLLPWLIATKMERSAGILKNLPSTSCDKRPREVMVDVVDHAAKRQWSIGSQFYLNELLADIEFDLGTRTVPAHRNILVSSSEVFR